MKKGAKRAQKRAQKRPTVNNPNEHWAERAKRSNGRLVLHRAFISIGGVAFLHWYPLLTMSEILAELAQVVDV
jgi:hypothetical protein